MYFEEFNKKVAIDLAKFLSDEDLELLKKQNKEEELCRVEKQHKEKVNEWRKFKKNQNNWNDWITGKVFEKAIISGDISYIIWLLNNECGLPSDPFKIVFDNFDLMNLLLANGCPFTDNTFINAILHNNLDLIKWLIVNKCPFSNDVFFNAV